MRSLVPYYWKGVMMLLTNRSAHTKTTKDRIVSLSNVKSYKNLVHTLVLNSKAISDKSTRFMLYESSR